VSDDISIQFTRFSAFYSPLIATIAGGFLQSEGFAPRHSVAPAGKSAIEGVLDGSVHVCQSAPSQGFGPLEKGQKPPVAHFAQINEKDGFFLTGRAPDPGLPLGQASRQGGARRPRRPAAGHVQVRLPPARAGLRGPQGGRCAQMDSAFREGQGD
jgi:NitT/TauT family transport system substrate-binding protein